MKLKFNVTIEKEESTNEILDESFIKSILASSVSNQNTFLVKKPFVSIKVSDGKLQLKKGKFFKKYKSIKLTNINKSFVLENNQDILLLIINIESFSGYLVLKISTASNLFEFIKILQGILNHQHQTISKGSIYYEIDNKEMAENENVETISLKIEPQIQPEEKTEISELPNGYEVYETELDNSYDAVDSKIIIQSENEEDRFCEEHKELKSKIYRVDSNPDEYTYLNYNSEELFINKTGPVALFSQTYPSPYSIENDANNSVDGSGSDSNSNSDSSHSRDRQFI